MKRLILLYLMLFALLNAIEVIDADGNRIPQDRQYHFNHHNSTNDYNIYGANRWAVRFNLQSAYPGVAQVSFNVQGARLWFPYPGDSATVELYTDFSSQPGTLVSSKTVNIDANQIDILFDASTNLNSAWLVVNYTTNMNNRYVAASAGGGSNSYFLNQIGENSYLSSLAAAGFNCELLFGLLGEFVLTEPDLELVDFDLLGDVSPGARVSPTFTLYNHSDIQVNNAEVSLVLNKPGFPAYDALSIPIPESIPPRTQWEFSPMEILFELPEEATQIRLEAHVQSEFAENDTLLINNSKVRTINLFTDPMPVMLVENFLRESETAPLASLQEPLLAEGIHVLQHYPVLTDPNANLAAIRRFNWYGFNSIPRTVGNGYSRITGLNQSYAQNFEYLIDTISTDRSFITNSSCRLDSIPDSENVNLTITLENQNTAMYSGVNQSLMSGSRFFVGLYARPTSQEAENFTLLRWIAFADTINNPIGIGSTVEKSYTISSTGLFDESLDLSYRIYYFIQGNDGGRIRFANYQSFSSSTYSNNQEELAPVVSYNIRPNPARRGDIITLSLDKHSPTRLSIYNIRGQKIFDKYETFQDMELDPGLFPSSGIYFFRVSQDGNRTLTKKISIIK